MPRILVSKHYSSIQEPRLLGKMADSKTKEKQVKDEPGIPSENDGGLSKTHRMFPDKKKPKEFNTIKPILQKMLETS